MLKKISVRDLRQGMHLHELCGAWMDHPFWRTKFTLRDAGDIRRILDSGITEVWIDTGKGADVAGEAASETAAEAASLPAFAPAEAPRRAAMADEVRRAARICARTKEAVVSMFSEARMGRAIAAEAAAELVEEIATSVMRNPGALISLARLKTADDYTYMHSVAVCALMVALARQLGLDEEKTREAGMAGLLHDLGKALMPIEVLNKPGRLTDAEFGVIKGHPAAGHQLLVEGRSASDHALDVCLHHHERIDGSGYPHGLSGEAISLYSKMGAVCDVYDAITSNRPYKKGWDPAESIHKMTEWSANQYDQRVFQAFVKSIGIYPTGSLVMLESGRLAVVVEQSDKSLLAPRVKAFFSARSRVYIPPESIDLSRPGATEKIVGREDPAKWNLRKLDELWAT